MMIYIIDDKKSRQVDYGWDKERFKEFDSLVAPIWNIESLIENQQSILQSGNIVLFHESFLASNDDDRKQNIDLFKTKLKEMSSSLFVAYFSGSKNGRYVDDNLCMLPPDVLYLNLEIFIKKVQDNEKDFKYLAFGENYLEEESIRHNLEEVNDDNVGGEKIHTGMKLFFAVSSEDEVEPPFDDVETINGWDFFDEDVSDTELDELVMNWFSENKYEAIYLPLYFGNVYSDYMGLRLAMHIRLTETPNRNVPIFIYGVSSYYDLCSNESFEVFKFSSVHLVRADNKSLKESLNIKQRNVDVHNDIKRIFLNVPSNIGDNHSVANKWAISRWCDMLQWKGCIPNLIDPEFTKSLYFKFLVAKHGQHDKFSKKQKYYAKISGIERKTILYIDDEYDKGWETILKYIFDSSDARLVCFKDFDKKISREELVKRIKDFLNNQEADCYLIDLRLHEDDFGCNKMSDLTGHTISEYIKSQNAGNQIVVFSASNKIWNLKEELFRIGASGYALKESPELNLTRSESLRLFIDFCNAVQLACKMSYLKEIVKKQSDLKVMEPTISQLDGIINLLSKDKGDNDKDLINSALLAEIVFIEDYLKNNLGYTIIKTGEKEAKKVVLWKPECERRNNEDDNILLTGHLFFRREKIGSHYTVTDVSEFFEQYTELQSGWCEVSDSDVTLVVSVLMAIFKLPRNIVKKYIDFKLLRNTQIAHNVCGSDKKKIKADEVVDFYYTVICPIVEKRFSPTSS